VLELIENGVDEVMQIGGQILDIIDGTFELPDEIDLFKYVMAEVGMGDLTDPLLQYFVEDNAPKDVIRQFLWTTFLKPELESLIDSYLEEEKTMQTEEDMIETLRFLVFNHDENDGTVRVESQLGSLDRECADCVTVIENVLHAFAPRYLAVQEKVLSLLDGGMWHFHPDGFPVATQALPFYYPEARIGAFRRENSRPEAICQSGMMPAHAEAFARVADEENVIIIVRPVNPDGLDLLRKDAATKKMDVKPKSSNWGPQKGYLPVNQRYSKIPKIFVGDERTAKIEAYNLKAQENLNDTVTLARPLQIQLCNTPYDVFIDHSKNGGIGDDNVGDEVVLIPVQSPDLVCTWESPFSTDGPLDINRLCKPKTIENVLEPLMVMASLGETEVNGSHRFLTADYDLLMTGFHKGASNPYDPPTNIPFQSGIGQITPDQLALLQKLNTAANHAGGDLSHHGPENQFSLSPYIDYPLTVFAPDDIEAPSRGEIRTIFQGPKGFRDIELKRYVNKMRERGYDLYDNVAAPGWKWTWNVMIDGFELTDSPELPGYIEQLPPSRCDKQGNENTICGPDQNPQAELPPHTSSDDPGMNLQWHVYPNPLAFGQATIAIVSDRRGTVTVHISDLLGSPVHVTNVLLEQGSNEIRLDLFDLQKGSYHLMIQGYGVVRLVVM
jgi:hypothetical protein